MNEKWKARLDSAAFFWLVFAGLVIWVSACALVVSACWWHPWWAAFVGFVAITALAFRRIYLADREALAIERVLNMRPRRGQS